MCAVDQVTEKPVPARFRSHARTAMAVRSRRPCAALRGARVVYVANATQPVATGNRGYGCCASARSSSSAICREPPLAILTAEGNAKKQTNTQANKQTNVLLVLVQRPRESDTSHGTGRHANDGYCCERSAAHPAELSVRWPGAAAAAGGAYNRRHARGIPRRAHATPRRGKVRRDATATCALRDDAAGVGGVPGACERRLRAAQRPSLSPPPRAPLPTAAVGRRRCALCAGSCARPT